MEEGVVGGIGRRYSRGRGAVALFAASEWRASQLRNQLFHTLQTAVASRASWQIA